MNSNAKTISYSLGLLLISLCLFGASIWIVPTADATIPVVATVEAGTLTVGEIWLCDGDCDMPKSMDPDTYFTIKVRITDPNGWNDINTESFSIQFYSFTDTNGCTPNWDCNVTNILDHNIVIGTANGCTHAPATGIYCMTIPTSGWTTKFLNGDANVYISADDNHTGGTFYRDWNALPDNNLWTINQSTGISEDTTAGTYSGVPNTDDVNFVSGQGTNEPYVDSTHNGNCNLELKITASNFTEGIYIMEDGNQSWHLTNMAADSTPFTGGEDTVESAWTRGSDPTSNTQEVYTWLDIPDQQPPGSYDGNMTYNSSAS